MLGEGKEFTEFITKAKSFNVDNRIIYRGYVPYDLVPCYLKASDLCLFPSLSEGFGNSIIEAMAAGLPTIIFKNIYIEEFGSNILVANDNEEFIELTKRLVYDKNYACEIGKKCAKDAEKLSISNTVEKFLKIFS